LLYETLKARIVNDSRLSFCLDPTYIFYDQFLLIKPRKHNSMLNNQNPKSRKWLVFAILLGTAILMYVSIMYKIINYGP
jgi:hypothetical protein